MSRRTFKLQPPKLISSLATIGVAASMAGLGTFATFTSSTSASQDVSTGTVTIALGTPGPANRLTVSATFVAAGDTVQRAFDLSNTGTGNSLEGLSSTLTYTFTGSQRPGTSQ